jgi:LmbE family N-acetylglucosaminyl deacetylase
MKNRLCILFAGAHPDDIEIGAGALVQQLVRDGHEVWALILTDDMQNMERRQEGEEALQCLGVLSSNVLFLGAEDGALLANSSTVARVRSIAKEQGIKPDVVVTHSSADSHNDHRAANSLLRAAFRKVVFLLFSIHVSAEPSHFRPRFFSSVDETCGSTKRIGLAAHRSQAARIVKMDLSEYEQSLGAVVGLERAEAFELEYQNGAESILDSIADYNDSPFLRLWAPLVGDRDIHLFYEAFIPQPKSIAADSTYHESTGRDRLRESFASAWRPTNPLREHFSNSPDAEVVLRSENVILVGGGVNNPLVRDHFNRWRPVTWTIEYDMPGMEPVYLLHRPSGRRFFPERLADGSLERDAAVLTIMRNPMNRERWVVACGGVHGLGTQGLLHFLAMPATNPVVFARLQGVEMVEIPLWVSKADLSLGEIAPPRVSRRR